MDKHELDNRNYVGMKNILKEMNPVDIAEELEAMEDKEIILIFRMLPKDAAAEVFAYLDSDVQEKIITAVRDHEIKDIVDELFVDDAVDFIEEMPANVVKRVLANVPAGKRCIINQFLKYPEDSAGSIMTIEYIAVKENHTVDETYAYIRQKGVSTETVNTLYVIGGKRRLTGVVSIRNLLLADFEDKIGDIMDTAIISARTDEDKESLANNFRKYGLLAMPVVDHENRLVGIVTVDDVLTIVEEEATEDIELMAGISPTDEPYLKASVWNMAKRRFPWLLILMLTATVTGTIIDGFEDAIAVIPALVAFIPLLMDTGGNAGAQASALIIRGMALEEIRLRDAWRVMWKEMRVAFTCGILLSLVNLGRILLLNPGSLPLAMTVSLTLLCTVMLSKSVGCLLPMGAKKIKIDPAVMASPVITSIADIGALLIFFNIAKAIFGI